MKLLSDILYKAGIEEVIGNTHIAVETITFDSRAVDKMSLFVAIRGTQVDGHQFINVAVEAGAQAIVCEQFPALRKDGVTYIRVLDSAKALGTMAANFYDNPSEQIKLIGITGTNGKTTIATLLHKLFHNLGYQVGLLSTIHNKIGNQVIPSTHTTPDAIQLNALLARMVDEGCDFAFMEVSSHALVQHRVTGIEFTGAAFTNITHDHLDYHETFDNYIKAKKMLFDMLPKSAFALLNKDDLHWEVMGQNTKAQIHTYALKSIADYKVKISENQFTGMQLQLGGQEVWTKLIGTFNASNLLAVYAIANELIGNSMDVLTAISALDPVDGRFQYLRGPQGVVGIVDYAHTPDALEKILSTINGIRTGNEQLITVVGCGGDRDKSKRPKMSAAASKASDRVILTSDNPRTENPDAILKDMQAGVPPLDYKKVLTISDRNEAIKTAVAFAEKGDIILIAGKGHEKYQEIDGVKHPFDDVAILNQMLNPVS